MGDIQLIAQLLYGGSNWQQRVVFGLGIATMLTLVFTPSLLAIRIWFVTYVAWTGRFLARVGAGKSGKSAQDWALRRAAKRQKNTEIIWEDGFLTRSLVGKDDIETAFKLNAKTHAAE